MKQQDPVVDIKPGTLEFDVREPDIIMPDVNTNKNIWSNDYYQKRLEKELKQAVEDNDLEEIDWLTRALNRLSKWTSRSSSRYVHVDKSMAKRTHAQATKLVNAINPKADVKWHTTSLDTDFSDWDPKTKRWTVHLDPRRYFFADKRDTKQQEPTKQMVQSTIGAAIHEVSHTLYTPAHKDLKEWLLNYETLLIFRIYEDMYINSYMIESRLPGAKPFLDSANYWTNPPTHIDGYINEWFTNGNEPADFETWVNVLAWLDYVGRWQHQTAQLRLPNQTCKDIYDEVKPISDQLAAGEYIDPDVRREMFQEIADIISKRFPPALHQEAPDVQFETVPETDENGEPNKHAGATRTTLDQKIDDGFGTDPADLQSLGDYLDDLLHCSQTGSDTPLPQDLLNQLENINNAIEVAKTDGLQALDDVDYTRSQKGEFPDPKIDEKRVEALRGVFRAKASIRRQFVHGLTEGRLSLRKLHKLARSGQAKRTNIFKRRPIIDEPQAAILLLVDGSGSMSGAPYDTASQAAKELYLAIRGNPDYKLHVWTYSSSGSSVSIKSATAEGTDLYWPQFLAGGTPSYEAMDVAHKFLKSNYKNQRRILIHFTDLGFGDTENQWSGDIVNDEYLDYMTVAVNQHGGRASWLDSYRTSHPKMKISFYDTSELVKATQDFVTSIT